MRISKIISILVGRKHLLKMNVVVESIECKGCFFFFKAFVDNVFHLSSKTRVPNRNTMKKSKVQLNFLIVSLLRKSIIVLRAPIQSVFFKTYSV